MYPEGRALLALLLAGAAGLRTPGGLQDECLVIRFVTGNDKKLREAIAILDETGLPLPLVRCELDLDELQSDSPEKIAAAKCALAAKITGGPVMVDDTSLCLDALDGMPGPYIKWFGGGRADVLARMLDGFDDKKATALSCVAFAVGPETVPLVFTGRCSGEIVEPVGSEGFGWDRSFRPGGSSLTFAQMDFAAKNQISHRAHALRSFSAYLRDHSELLVKLCGENIANPDPPQADYTRFHRRRGLL